MDTHIFALSFVQVFSTAMGGVGLACPLIVPKIRAGMGLPTYNYYGAKSRCGELDYSQSNKAKAMRKEVEDVIEHGGFHGETQQKYETANLTWRKTVGSGRPVRGEDF